MIVPSDLWNTQETHAIDVLLVGNTYNPSVTGLANGEDLSLDGITAVPEPASIVLIALGVGGSIAMARRRVEKPIGIGQTTDC